MQNNKKVNRLSITSISRHPSKAISINTKLKNIEYNNVVHVQNNSILHRYKLFETPATTKKYRERISGVGQANPDYSIWKTKSELFNKL